MIDYPTFLANVTDEDLRIMTLVAHKQTIATTSATEADATFVTLKRLYDNKLITRGERAWERQTNGDGTETQWQIFEAKIESLAVSYLTQMCMDRIKMSRQPLP